MRQVAASDQPAPRSAAPSLGVVYLSFGEKYRQLTELSVSFLRASGYAGPVRIVTTSPTWRLDHLDCEMVKVPYRGLSFATRYYKTQINQYAFDITLFLDADTLPIANIRPLWRELRFADICMARDYHPLVQEEAKIHYWDRPRRRPEYDFMYSLGLMGHVLYNSGVMLFRSSAATDKFFAAWHNEWKRFQHEDQLALIRAIARTKTNIHLLASRWNGSSTRFESVRQAQSLGVRILHNLKPDSKLQFFRRGRGPRIPNLAQVVASQAHSTAEMISSPAT